MTKLKELWQDNRKACIIYGGIALISLLLIIIAIIFCINIFRRYDYPVVEKKMTEATASYLLRHPEYQPTEENPTTQIEVATLIEEQDLDELGKLSSDTGCTGYVTVHYENDKLRYVPYLVCNHYETKSLSETILSREDIVTTDNGLYELNDMYTYRGEYVNNYLRFVDYDWRIFKFDEEMMYLVLADTVNGKTNYIFDDRYNEISESYRGKNDFAQSRIYLSLHDIYNDYFRNYHHYLKTMKACVNTRSVLDIDKAGNIECFTTFETPISLLSVYDYMNASVDPLCLTCLAKNCSNYNYLSKTTNKWWLMNGTNENTYQVYFANNTGSLALDYASAKKYLRVVIAIPSDVVYKSGNGTSNNPFTFYEY